MKKNYITPQIEVLEIEIEGVVLQASTEPKKAERSRFLLHPYLTANAPHDGNQIDISNQSNNNSINCLVGLNRGTPTSAANINIEHLGGFMTINLTMEYLDGYTLESLTFGDDIPIVGCANLEATDIADCFTETKRGTIKVDVNQRCTTTPMVITFDILPCRASNAVIRLKLIKGDETKYIYKSSNKSMILERAKSYTIDLSISSADLRDNLPINNATDLAAVNIYLDGDYIMKNDIVLDCESSDWKPIGWVDGVNDNRFTGTFDGNDNSITGLKIDAEADLAHSKHDKKVLFTNNSGTIKGIKLVYCVVKERDDLADIASVNNGTISGCEVSGTIISSMGAGGVVGAQP